MLMKRPPSKDESGVVAVVAAITALVLIGICAFAVDLGNAFSRKRDVQSQADFAALAGANELGIGNTKVPRDPAVIAVADYLSKNKPQDDHAGPTPDVTPAQLVDNDDKNGEVYFTGDRMRVVTPKALVDYGLAGVLGQTEVNVHAEASVKILSGGGVMPFFAVDGCDYGPQTISTPPPGPAASLEPGSRPDNERPTRRRSRTSPRTRWRRVLTPSPALTITGSGFTSRRHRQQGGLLPQRRDDHRAGDHHSHRATPRSSSPAGAIPSSVTERRGGLVRPRVQGHRQVVEDRQRPAAARGQRRHGVRRCGQRRQLRQPPAPSDSTTTTPLRRMAPDQHRRGTTGSTHAQGPQEATAGPNWNCSDGVNDAVVSKTSPATLKPDTNCLDTDTGLPDTSATAGFVTGGTKSVGGPFPGRLNKDTTPGCGAQSSIGTRGGEPGSTRRALGLRRVQDQRRPAHVLPQARSDDQRHLPGDVHRTARLERGHLPLAEVLPAARAGQEAHLRRMREVLDHRLQASLPHRPAHERRGRLDDHGDQHRPQRPVRSPAGRSAR